MGVLIWLLVDWIVTQDCLLYTKIEKELLNSEKMCNIKRRTKIVRQTLRLSKLYNMYRSRIKNHE